MSQISKNYKTRFPYIFQIILFLFYFPYFNKSDDCPKEQPILKDNTCVLEYCTTEQFDNGECVISNKDTKIQWLNEKINFGPTDSMLLDYITNDKNDVILISALYDDNTSTDNKKYLYYLSSSDYSPFTDDSGSKTFETEIDSSSFNGRLFSTSISINIDDKNYILFFDAKYFDLIDYVNQSASYGSIDNLFGINEECSKYFPLSLIKLNNDVRSQVVTH